MSNNNYHKQVALLIKVIPEIALEPRFALHGGTAINLFDRDMPRLSVDIDLTYIPIEDRETSFTNISVALTNIKSSIEKRLQGSRVEHKVELHKLLVSYNDAMIKIEVSQIVRGTLGAVTEKILCKKAQEKFDTFCSINVVPKGQLYGGKVCAAMDRQHPRDIFDVKQLLQNQGFTEKIKEGFLFRLLSSDRSIQDVLFPNLQDQRLAMTNQFAGMSEEQFTYEEYEFVRETMVKTLQASITEADKLFILGFKDVIPNWAIYSFEKYPSIKWKLQNLEKIITTNPAIKLIIPTTNDKEIAVSI
jgi:predicted nucleotidyltransferase component of viral defense system